MARGLRETGRMVNEHSTDSELQARAEFRLSLDAAKVVDDHLRVCSACNARYRDIAKDKPSPPPAPELI
jgi:predicted anti-sigma-YlaC factor YlaD